MMRSVSGVSFVTLFCTGMPALRQRAMIACDGTPSSRASALTLMCFDAMRFVRPLCRPHPLHPHPLRPHPLHPRL